MLRLNYDEILLMEKEVGLVGIKMASILDREYRVFKSVSELVRYCGMDSKGDVSNGSKTFKKLLKFGYIRKEMLIGRKFLCSTPDYMEFLEYRCNRIKEE